MICNKSGATYYEVKKFCKHKFWFEDDFRGRSMGLFKPSTLIQLALLD